MKSITKEEYIELIESGDIVGLVLSTMKPSYKIPVIFEFTSIEDGILCYLLTNKNPELSSPYDRHKWGIHCSSFISDVRNSSYREIFILNDLSTPDWEV
jgi:hypothetical protein